MPLGTLNGFLNAFALINDGVNHGSSYLIEQLPDADSLGGALALYFASMKTSSSPSQPAERWGIRAARISGCWPGILENAGRRWFFEQEFSPKVDPYLPAPIARRFLECLQKVVGEASAFKVEVTPPMWYECEWEDYAFESADGRWLLHFGFSD